MLNVKLYTFLSDNNYVHKNIQKGFWPKSDGLSEHTEMLSHLMYEAKRNMRCLVVTLLDLKNAFGEVHHNLIRASLQFHHVPKMFTKIISNIYSGSKVKIAVNDEWTHQIVVERLKHILKSRGEQGSP